MNFQKYVRPQSLEEAYQLNQSKRNRIVGGMLWMKMSSENMDTAIDLCDLGLDQIEETEEQFSIGAMVSLRTLELHEGLNRYTANAVNAAVRDIVGVQFRNMATIGGSIWGRFGFSDVLTVFLAMDSYVELYKGGVIPMREFAAMKYDSDLLVRVIVKKTPLKIAYKAMRAQRTDFPVLACAVAERDGVVSISIGARPMKATIVDAPSEMKDAAEIAAFAAEQIPTGSNLRGSAAYRTHLIKVLTQRCLSELGGVQ